MSTLKILTGTVITVIAISCSNSTNKQDETFLKKLWDPKDSLAFYFPTSNNSDSGFSSTKGDKFKQNWYSSALFSFKEPILYNKKLSLNIHRFLWLRSFHRPVVFTFTNFGNKVLLTSKILDRQPEFLDHKYSLKGWPELESELKGKNIERIGDSLILVRADRKASIVYDTTIEVSVKEWDNFEKMLQKINFWKQPAISNEERGMDGSEWIIESLSKDKYWFVTRWTPDGDIKNIGVYLINLSGLKEEIY